MPLLLYPVTNVLCNYVPRTLAGSTIMLLTLPWLGSLILGRVDIVQGVGKDETRSKFSLKSFLHQVSFMSTSW